MPTHGLLRRRAAVLLLSAALGLGLVAAPIPGNTTPANAASYSAPSGLRAASVANNAIALTWNAVAGAPAYRVQFSKYSSMRGAKTMDLVTNYLEWTYLDPEPSSHSGRLKANTTYYFRVKVITAVDLAHTASSLSSYSGKLKVRTSNSASKQYLAPTALKVTGRSSTSRYISWASRGPGIHYRLRYGTSADLTGDDTRTAVFPYSGGIVSGLSAGTAYYYQVSTISSDDQTTLSPYSAILHEEAPGATGSPAIRVADNNVCSYACSDWDGRRAVIVDELSYQDPDIITLQEAARGSALIDDYNAKANRSFRLVTYSAHANIAYDTDRFSDVDHGVLTFSEDSAKNAVWAILADRKDGGRKFFVVSVHLTNSDSSDAQRKRPLEAKELVQTIDANNSDNLPVILAGDFNVSKRKNDHPAVYGAMTAAGLTDPLGNPSDSRYVARSASAEHRIDVNYASANQNQRHALRAKWLNGYDVDYIWTTSDVRVAMFQVVVNLNTSGDFVGTIPTDHNMLVGSFHLS